MKKRKERKLGSSQSPAFLAFPLPPRFCPRMLVGDEEERVNRECYIERQGQFGLICLRGCAKISLLFLQSQVICPSGFHKLSTTKLVGYSFSSCFSKQI